MTTGHKIQIPRRQYVDKTGRVIWHADSTPAPLRKGKHAKAARLAKAWKAKSK